MDFKVNNYPSFALPNWSKVPNAHTLPSPPTSWLTTFNPHLSPPTLSDQSLLLLLKQPHVGQVNTISFPDLFSK